MTRKFPIFVDGKIKAEDVVVRRANAPAIMLQQLTDNVGRPKFKHSLDKRVIYGSPLVDVAGNMDLVKETIEMVEILMKYTHWQVRLLSKSNLLPKIAQYFDNPDWKHRIIYGVSTGTLNDTLAKTFEQGTPLVSKRIESLHWLQDNGFRTFGMICPSLPCDDYDKFAMDIRSAIRPVYCEHVWAEILNVRGESMNRTIKCLSKAGFEKEARSVASLSDKLTHEHYARETFKAHAKLYPPGKLRYLQYVTPQTIHWWKDWESQGAVLLGSFVHKPKLRKLDKDPTTVQELAL